MKMKTNTKKGSKFYFVTGFFQIFISLLSSRGNCPHKPNSAELTSQKLSITQEKIPLKILSRRKSKSKKCNLANCNVLGRLELRLLFVGHWIPESKHVARNYSPLLVKLQTLHVFPPQVCILICISWQFKPYILFLTWRGLEI